MEFPGQRLGEWQKIFNLKIIDHGTIKSIVLLYENEKNKNIQFYRSIILPAETYPEDKSCLKIISHAYFYVAEILVNSSEDYLKSLEFDSKLHQICSITKDTSFYNQNSIKLLCCDKIALIYEKDSKFKEAIEYYDKISNHAKVKKCFDLLICSR